MPRDKLSNKINWKARKFLSIISFIEVQFFFFLYPVRCFIFIDRNEKKKIVKCNEIVIRELK